MDVLNLGPTAWPALPSKYSHRHGDAKSAAAELPFISDAPDINTHTPRQDTPFNDKTTNNSNSGVISNIPPDLPRLPLETCPSENSPKIHNYEDLTMFTINQLRDQITGKRSPGIDRAHGHKY